MPLTVATWNINSVRLRLPLVLQFLADHDIDVLCLQETKVDDAKFPLKPIKEAGYPHVVMNGRGGHHGVATISRLPLTNVRKLEFMPEDGPRHVAAVVDDRVELHNYYVPSGGDDPDPVANPKFDHKLRYVDAMSEHYGGLSRAPEMILAGDLNVAPLECDVWSHKQLLNVVSHTPVEVERLTALAQSIGWVDVVREHTPPPEKLYSWWSYRARDWQVSNRGRRLDHIWATPGTAATCDHAAVFSAARGWERPSDHVPVIASFRV